MRHGSPGESLSVSWLCDGMGPSSHLLPIAGKVSKKEHRASAGHTFPPASHPPRSVTVAVPCQTQCLPSALHCLWQWLRAYAWNEYKKRISMYCYCPRIASNMPTAIRAQTSDLLLWFSASFPPSGWLACGSGNQGFQYFWVAQVAWCRLRCRCNSRRCKVSSFNLFTRKQPFAVEPSHPCSMWLCSVLHANNSQSWGITPALTIFGIMRSSSHRPCCAPEPH